MPPRKKVSSVVEDVVVEEVPVDEPADDEVSVETTPVVVADNTKTAKVKGSWSMYWGNSVYEFEDGKRYKLPLDLYGYLVQHGNIYDTL